MRAIARSARSGERNSVRFEPSNTSENSSESGASPPITLKIAGLFAFTQNRRDGHSFLNCLPTGAGDHRDDDATNCWVTKHHFRCRTQ